MVEVSFGMVGQRVFDIDLDADQLRHLGHQPDAVQVEQPERQGSFRPTGLQILQMAADPLELLPRDHQSGSDLVPTGPIPFVGVEQHAGKRQSRESFGGDIGALVGIEADAVQVARRLDQPDPGVAVVGDEVNDLVLGPRDELDDVLAGPFLGGEGLARPQRRPLGVAVGLARSVGR
ncbi:MAG: hypothetical protein ACR2QK_09250 [Acidimicrobiales bacterium]